MKPGKQKIILLVVALLLSCGQVMAQDKTAPVPEIATQSTENADLEAALATDDPAQRVASLRQFLTKWPEAAKADTAREALIQGLAIQAERQLSGQNIENALDLFRQTFTFLPQNISDRFFEETLLRIPVSVAVRGYRAEAVGLAREIEARSLTDVSRLGALGEFYISLESVPDALRALEKAVVLAPEDARILRTLGTANRMSLRLEEATRVFRRVIANAPADKRAYYELANLRRAHGAYDEARTLYQKQVDLDPAFPAARKGIALTLFAQGKKAEAEAELEKVVALAKNPGEVRQDFFLQTQMAFYLRMHDQKDAARRAADQALAAEPRFVWARIASAEMDMTEGRYFEAERHLLAARQYGSFPTLEFALGRLYMMVEDFDGAVAQFGKAFSRQADGGFTALLGGILDARDNRLMELFAREQQAAMFLFEPLADFHQYRLAETLTEMEAEIQTLRKSVRPENNEHGPDRALPLPTAVQEGPLEKAVAAFVEAEPTRKPFRALFAARKLALLGIAPDIAVRFADQAAQGAEVATKPDGALRDYPNYDRDGRLAMFRGRALDAKGWALLKAGRNDEAITALEAAVAAYASLSEGKQARWRLAAAREAAGQLPQALALYLESYEAPATGSVDLNRKVIEALYRKVHGSMNGLEERIGKPMVAASLPPATAPVNSPAIPAKPETAAPQPLVEKPVAEKAEVSATALPARENLAEVETTAGKKREGETEGALKSSGFSLVIPDLSRGVAGKKVTERTGKSTEEKSAVNMGAELVYVRTGERIRIPPVIATRETAYISGPKGRNQRFPMPALTLSEQAGRAPLPLRIPPSLETSRPGYVRYMAGEEVTIFAPASGYMEDALDAAPPRPLAAQAPPLRSRVVGARPAADKAADPEKQTRVRLVAPVSTGGPVTGDTSATAAQSRARMTGKTMEQEGTDNARATLPTVRPRRVTSATPETHLTG
ncbi:MAG: tetratricopeptide repeat protein, partial [Blastocatellia bacterium]